MDNDEARRLLAAKLTKLRKLPHEALVRDLLDRPQHDEVTGDSGTHYQVECEAFWDHKPQGNLRVMVSIDDGGWRAFVPLSDSFIIAPDGSFVGE